MDAKEREGFYKIRDLCQKVIQGDYSHVNELKEMTLQSGYSKAIEELAESICKMIFKLHKHECELEAHINDLQATQKELQKARDSLKEKNISLKEKVHCLEINIDQMKRNREVAQITQSAFFKKIKKNASQRKKK